MPSSGLPTEVENWIEQASGPISRIERHPARREAWLVDVIQPGGGIRSCFLRIDRPGVAPSVNVEADVVRALGSKGIPVPALYAWNPALACALYEKIDGQDSVADLPQEEAQRVMERFIDLVAAWHRIAPASLNVGLPVPASAEACALDRPNALSQLTGDPGVEPLRTFGKWWIEQHVPRPMPPLALVQGDTGPGNFMFAGHEVTAVTDWEWARFGDPMEDLGTICCRCLFFAPQVDLGRLFRRYQDVSEVELDFARIRFYRVQQMVQSVIVLQAVTHDVDPAGPAALNLAYRIRGDFVCCDAIALAMGIRLDEPKELVPRSYGLAPSFDLFNAAHHIISDELSPALSDPYLHERAQWSDRLAEALDRRGQLGAALVDQELEELGALLGRAPGSVIDGLDELDRRILAWNDVIASPGTARLAPEVVLEYLWRRACRNEELYEPLLRFLPSRRFSPIEMA